MKKILTIVILVLVVAGIIFFSKNKKEVAVVPSTQTPNVTEPIKLCFYKETKTKNGLHDISWISMNLKGDKVDGEFQYLPAEKDKKVGKFKGNVGPVDKMAMARTADVWWDSMAEGMQVKEQLIIVFGEGNANAAFGEMVDRGDGVYVYKNTTKLTYGESMTDIACDDIPVKLAIIQMENNTCYAYHQVATKDAPYKVDEYINIKVTGNIVTGTKKGTQSGPDMTNGYTGAIKGTLDKSAITSIFSYIIEGAKNNEREIYNVVAEGLDKIRYPLIEEEGILVPDITKQATIMKYSNIDCSEIKSDQVVSPLDTKYIKSVNKWPPKVEYSKIAFTCSEGDNNTDTRGLTVKKLIDTHNYCVTSEKEGAAGSAYTTYTYSTEKGGQTAKVSFILQTVQCMNYDNPKQTECKNEQNSFNIDLLANSLVFDK